MTGKVRRFEVIGRGYNCVGYVWAQDVAHAWAQAYERYSCKFVIFGA